MRSITISVDDELWQRVHQAADKEHVSVDALIRTAIQRMVRPTQTTVADRLTEIARSAGPAPQSWQWDREELYKETG